MRKHPVFNFFSEICAIPRESGHEQGMTAYLTAFAKQRGLACKTDSIGNVVISKPASKGKENSPCIILQSHTDMVCEKNADVVHDFRKDPIEAYEEDGWLMARGTTLGADDGIGVAAELAVLDSQTLEHGPIECLFTVSEETGLDGARAIKPDFLTGNILLNLDSEDEGEIFIGCAGGIDTTARFGYTDEEPPLHSCARKVKITGLCGGHSGDDIDKGLANANQLLARFLRSAQEIMPLAIHRIEGGNKRNAIAREAYCICCIPEKETEAFEELLARSLAQWQFEFRHSEPGLNATIEQTALPDRVVDARTARNLILSLHACPHGVMAMSLDVPGLVETSSNLASIKMEKEGEITVGTSQRSAINSARRNAATRIESVFLLAGARVSHESEYPGWNPNNDSPILKTCIASYKRLFNSDIKVRAIHAGLECGLFLGSFPRMDMVSFGPTLRGVHSPQERLEIASVYKFWDFLTDILKNA